MIAVEFFQQVIVYDAYGKTHVYATAYGPHEVKTQIFYCVCEHGRGANVRSADARLHQASETR